MISVEDNAIILKLRKHGETSAVMQMLTQEHGVYHGVVRSVTSKNNRGIYQPGNLIHGLWSARIAEHIGSIKGELLRPYAAHIMQSPLALSVLSSMCAMLVASLPERHTYPKLFDAALALLDSLQAGNDADFLHEYVEFELTLLAETGFGLDLSSCASTGQTHDLLYVSPKSGRAVSREAGEPYKGKLLKLPSILKAFPLEGGRLDGGVLKNRARTLRKNLTDAETKLWHLLNHKQMEGIKFRRQHPIGGRYIVDFISLSHRLIIELDGGQHTEQQSYDASRTEFLEAEGYRVLRFWNNEVIENSEGVWSSIHTALLSPPPQPSPLKGEGEIMEALALTGYFLEHWLLESHHKKMPQARERLVKMLARP